MVNLLCMSFRDVCLDYEVKDLTVTEYRTGIDEVGVQKKWQSNEAWKNLIWDNSNLDEIIEDFEYFSLEAKKVYFPLILLKIIVSPSSISEYSVGWDYISKYIASVDETWGEKVLGTISALSHTIYHMMKMGLFDIDEEDKVELERILNPGCEN